LTDDPVKLLKEGTFLKIPIIIGRTENEFVDVVPSEWKTTS
jgi:hypothetical protein